MPNNYWDFKYENTKEYTHSIHSYPAVMVSPISRNIINIVRQVMEVDSLFDPFSGSGTVLVEGMLANIKTVYGNDINPLAIFISKVKTFVKKVELLLKAGKKEEAVSQAKSAESILAKAASKGRIHKNKAARKTSRMYKSLKK